MNKYETLYIVKTDREEEAIKQVLEKFSGIVESNGGTVDSVEEWGKRKLAYPIDDLTEGYYVRMLFTADFELPKELERNMRISEDIIRCLVIRLEE